jgi:PRC-barrel domain
MDHPRAGLKYVAADDLDHSMVDFNHLPVVSTAGEKLGEVDGFILDVNVVQPYYVVVNAGGWFTSKYFLLPVGYITFDRDARTLVADVSRDRIAEYPGFDRDEFDTISDEELERFDQAMRTIGGPADAQGTLTAYRTPTWWNPADDRGDR